MDNDIIFDATWQALVCDRLPVIIIIVHVLTRHILNELHERKVVCIGHIVDIVKCGNLSTKLLQEFRAIPKVFGKLLSPRRHQPRKGMPRVYHFAEFSILLNQLGDGVCVHFVQQARQLIKDLGHAKVFGLAFRIEQAGEVTLPIGGSGFRWKTGQDLILRVRL